MTVRWPEVERALAGVAVALHTADRVAVVGHVNPDLDSIGSVLALRLALSAMGKQAWAVTPEPDPPYWHFLPGHDELVVGAPQWLEPRVVVVLDTEPSSERLGAAWPLVGRAALLVNVDHHETNAAPAHHSVVEPSAAATGELVYFLIRVLGVPVTADIASCLYAAVLTDTGSFRYSNTTARTLSLAAELVAAGADPHDIATRVYDTRPWEYVKLLGRLLSRLERSEDGRVAWLWLDHRDAREAGLAPSEIEGLVQFPRMVQGVEVALLFKELEPGVTRVSLRSQRYVDVSAIARTFGGGGHLRAAGCTLHVPLAEAIPRVVEVCRAAVQQAKTAAVGSAESRPGEG